jgi:hypothetical protein
MFGYDAGWFTTLFNHDVAEVIFCHGGDDFCHACVVSDDVDVFGHDVFDWYVACQFLFAPLGYDRRVGCLSIFCCFGCLLFRFSP